ncbi:MAG: saccharopine dehydrogenase NADP-binding domain-containing protein [Micrococcales bacterium]|nr:saccharopine dehydrogenase NADP-binding domain-containing protein [Micrococcales bacterium]
MSQSPTPRDSREHDIVLYGATGFVGRLIAEYLSLNAPDGARIALAGRSRSRLEEARATLGARAAEWPLVVADATDATALADLAGSTRVVLTTVGPYARYGMHLLEACATAGTHYCDLTGEVLFVREAADHWDATARQTGARIVNSCGFDSVPSDLSVHLLDERVKADGAGDLTDTTLLVTRMRGGFSGGTIDSMRGQLEAVHNEPALKKVVIDAYALSPDRDQEPQLGKERDLGRVTQDKETGQWLAPFVMASYNTRIVRRSNALRGHAYGRQFRYREAQAFGSDLKGRGRAWAWTLGLGALMAGMSQSLTRPLIDRVLPSPGDGPSAESRAAGRFRMETRTVTSTARRYLAVFAAKGDPGYAATSVMIGESALALAFDEDRLPDAAGVLTPATGIGTVLADRLREAGFTITVEEIA